MSDITIKNILFPIDFSSSSEKIVPYVKTMANKFQAEVYILFVVRMFHYYRAICAPGFAFGQFEEETMDGANARMEDFVTKYFNETFNTHPEIIKGDTPEEIINYTYRKNIDLIIMGTHGRKGLDKAVFGSVAQRVVRNSSIPVFVVNPYRKEKEEKRLNTHS